MAVKTVAELKQRFESGDIPTAQDFIDFLDSFLHAAGGNFPNPLPAVDASALTNIPIPNPLPARDASSLYNINPSEWTVHATNASYASANTFVLTGDQRSRFLQTRRLRIQSGASYLYTEVNGITYDAGTDTSTVTTLDSILVPGISQVAYAMFTPANANGAISARMIGAVAEWLPSATDPASMSVRVGAGRIIKTDGTLVSQAAQTLAFVAPAANPRIDRIVVDMLSGVASIVAGAEAASPAAPTITAGKLPCAQVALTVGQAQITNASITDERTALVSSPQITYHTATGTDTYTVSGLTLVQGFDYRINFTNANTSTAPTVNGTTIKKEGGVALVAGDIPAGHSGVLRHIGADLILLNPKTSPGNAQQIVYGAVNGDGTIARGAGFSVSKTGTGQYVITPSPAISGTLDGFASLNAGGNQGATCQSGPGSVTVFTKAGGTPTDIPFTFCVIKL